MHGRDLSAQLIDNKTTPSAFRNQTASQIATSLATKYGLSMAITPTTTHVGTYWDADHISLSDQRSEWDLLTYLASQEGFATWVKGRQLYFGPSPFLETPKEFYELAWDDSTGVPTFNGKNISFSRSLTIAKGVTVTANSFQTKSKKNVTASYPRSSKSIAVGGSKAVGVAQNHRLRLPPNKSVLEVENAAKKKYDEIVAHMMKMKATLPGDHYLDATKALRVSGTGTGFDQVYYPDSLVHTMSMDAGYEMEITAKNTAPENEPNL